MRQFRIPLSGFPDFLQFLEGRGRVDFPEDLSDGAEAIASEVR